MGLNVSFAGNPSIPGGHAVPIVVSIAYDGAELRESVAAQAGNISCAGQWKLFVRLLLKDHCTRTKPRDVELPHLLSPCVQAEPTNSPVLVCVVYGQVPGVAQAWWWPEAAWVWGCSGVRLSQPRVWYFLHVSEHQCLPLSNASCDFIANFSCSSSCCQFV